MICSEEVVVALDELHCLVFEIFLATLDGAKTAKSRHIPSQSVFSTRIGPELERREGEET